MSRYIVEDWYRNENTGKMEHFGNEEYFNDYEDATDHADRNLNPKEYGDGIYETRIYLDEVEGRDCVYRRKFLVARMIKELGTENG